MFDFIGLGNGLINVVLLLVILVVLVLIHEFGHFLVARRAGVTVHEFGIGFPPRAKVLGTDKQGTVYTLNWLPIGGFVRLEGEEGRSDDPRAFINQRLRTRLTILLAGVTMNIVLAFLVFVFIAAFADPSASVQIASVLPDSPAAAAGLHGGAQIGTVKDENGIDVPVYDGTGDQILAIDGHRWPWFEDPLAAITYLRDHPSTTVTLLVQHADGTRQELLVTTRSKADIDAGKGALGFSPRAYLASDTIAHDPLSAVNIGFNRTLEASTLVLRGIGELITNLRNPPVIGPVGMAGAIGAIRENYPPVYLLWLAGVLSANLAVVNVLPFPPLDGGRVAVALIQAITRGRISIAAERLAYLTGFILLMALLLWITLFDTGVLQRQV
jgi:regulator of sigma E protease